MASETATPPTPPPLIRIVHSPYDSDNESAGAITSPNSFIHSSTCENQKARARGGSKKITFLDGLTRNATSIGQSMAVHANRTLQTLVEPETSDDDDVERDYEFGSYDARSMDKKSRRRWRKSKFDRLMVKALDRADGYATALCHIIDHVNDRGCMGGNGLFICGEDDDYSNDSWSSRTSSEKSCRERRTRTKGTIKKKKKLVSSASPYDVDDLSDSISVTSCDATYEGMFDGGKFEEESEATDTSPDEVSFNGQDSSTPKKETAVAAPCTKASLIRERREEFLRRKIAIHRGDKRLEIRKPRYIQSKELRAKYFGHTDFDRERLKLTKQDDNEMHGESIPDLVDSSSIDDSADKSKYKWQSKVDSVVMPLGDSIFLTTSHLGPSVSCIPFDEKDSALQIGDVILRLNGEDVSRKEGSIVTSIFKSMSGKKVQVSFLRKRAET